MEHDKTNGPAVTSAERLSANAYDASFMCGTLAAPTCAVSHLVPAPNPFPQCLQEADRHE